MIALLAPGQGSQTQGMLSPWLELPGAADRIATWSKASGLDLARLGTSASTEEITDTAVAQPLIVAATLLAHEELTKRGLLAGRDFVVAGHSVGEIAAYAIAGVLAADDAVALAATRGAEMAKACASEPTGMSAVLGGDEADVLTRLDNLDLIAANRNAAGQIVAAGHLTALEKLAEDPPARARVRALGVAGAFHTTFMAPALDGYAANALGWLHLCAQKQADPAQAEVPIEPGDTEVRRLFVSLVADPVKRGRTRREFAMTLVLYSASAWA